MKIKQHNNSPISNLVFSLITIVLLFHISSEASAVGARKAEINHSPPPVGIAVDLNRDGKVDKDINQIKPEDILAGKKANDATTPALPYRFWVNNDLDVVNSSGDIIYYLSDCRNINNNRVDEDGQYQQVCEQWDEDSGGKTNTTGIYTTGGSPFNLLEQIESDRDLEDFSPLLIYISKGFNPEDYTIKLKAVGVSVNLFKSDWKDDGDNVSHAYIFDEQVTKQQVQIANAAKGHFSIALTAGVEVEINQQIIDEYFSPETGEAKFIFEATAPSPSGCLTNAENCYLELEVSKNDDETFEKITSRVYMDIHDVKDFYQRITAGSAHGVSDDILFLEDFDAQYFGSISEIHAAKLNVYQGLIQQDKLNKDYTLLVHGWRMQDAEKIGFAETSFKRLYWSGYQGKFGTLTRPTGWFNKPAHVYNTARQATFALFNTPNYDRSEAVARRVGVDLANYLDGNSGFNSVPNRHVIAHSMGNVVVSEALRHQARQAAGILFSTYIASNAAEVGGAYYKDLPTIVHKFFDIPEFACTSDLAEGHFTPEAAWRCYNAKSGTGFDMPPDLYRQTLPLVVNDGVNRVEHGSTTDIFINDEIDLAAANSNYYGNINQAVNIVVNVFNPSDTALDTWGFNQLTKPDNFGVGDWEYGNEAIDMQITYDNCKAAESTKTLPNLSNCDYLIPVFPDSVHSRFIRDRLIIFDQELIWSQALTEDSANILGFIVPARTNPLGHGIIDAFGLNNNIPLTGFTNSNQDHSAQFHGYYSETRDDNPFLPFRARYWNQVLRKTVGLFSNDRYTGLFNGKGLNQ